MSKLKLKIGDLEIDCKPAEIEELESESEAFYGPKWYVEKGLEWQIIGKDDLNKRIIILGPYAKLLAINLVPEHELYKSLEIGQMVDLK